MSVSLYLGDLKDGAGNVVMERKKDSRGIVIVDERGKPVMVPAKDEITVPMNIAQKIGIIRTMLEGGYGGDDEERGEEMGGSALEIPLVEVTRPVMLRVIEFLKIHLKNPIKPLDEPLRSFDMEDLAIQADLEFLKPYAYNPANSESVRMEQMIAFVSLIQAAVYLEIPDLLSLTMAQYCCWIKQVMNEGGMKQILAIDVNMTPEEELYTRDKSKWIFEMHMKKVEAR